MKSIPIRNSVQAFGNCHHPIPAAIAEEWNKTSYKWNQVHGTTIREITNPHQICGDSDGFFTRVSDLPLLIRHADCVPILLVDKKGRAACALHSGWRGTLAKIWEKGIGMIKDHDFEPSQWLVTIGPAIGPCCYEVSLDLIEQFKAAYPQLDIPLISPSHRKLDLQSILEASYKGAGFTEVKIIRECTFCSKDSSGQPLYQSFRRTQSKERQYSGIVLQN